MAHFSTKLLATGFRVCSTYSPRRSTCFSQDHVFDIFNASIKELLLCRWWQFEQGWDDGLSRYLLVDEIDKMTHKDQVLLLNVMETGIVSETKYGKTRSAQIKTSVFATSNNIKKLSAPLLSRFFIVELEPYTYEQFLEITNELLSHHKVVEGVVGLIANAVWNKSRDIRDCVRIGAMSKSIEDVQFVLSNFLK